MIARVQSFVLRGIEAIPCEIEVDIAKVGMSQTTIVGLPDAAVRESMQRVRTALRNSGFKYPRGRVTINLAPADIRKEGPVYDLPIAVALLEADGAICPSDCASNGGAERVSGELLIAGELALDGRVRSVRGAINLALLARQLRRRGVIVPDANVCEAAAVEGIEALGASTLNIVVAHLTGEEMIVPCPPVAISAGADADADDDRRSEVDFADVRGQEAAKRALTIAAAGAHNVLLIGPAGTGKTMMAKALPGVLPPMTPDEMLEVTRIHSTAGMLPPGRSLVRRRPVRAPHHTASGAAIIGGGSIPRPGDVTLAHRGVLFMDEMPEFRRSVLETLRQPLEDGCVTIARARGSVRFPARFMLVGALNPTARGAATLADHPPPQNAESIQAMDRYLERISGPLIDRVDIHVEVPAVTFRELTAGPTGASSAEMLERVLAARARQYARQGPSPNAELSGRVLDRAAAFDAAARALLGQAMSELGLSARAYDKVRRVARTIADIDGSAGVEPHHVAEAIQYRLLDRNL